MSSRKCDTWHLRFLFPCDTACNAHCSSPWHVLWRLCHKAAGLRVTCRPDHTLQRRIAPAVRKLTEAKECTSLFTSLTSYSV